VRLTPGFTKGVEEPDKGGHLKLDYHEGVRVVELPVPKLADIVGEEHLPRRVFERDWIAARHFP